MIKFQGISEQIHAPFLPLAAQHGFQLIFVEAAQGGKREHLLEAAPATPLESS
jgi:hypothetical protein